MSITLGHSVAHLKELPETQYDGEVEARLKALTKLDAKTRLAVREALEAYASYETEDGEALKALWWGLRG